MAASVIAAVLDLVESLDLPAGCTVWFEEAPLRVNGEPVVPPYVVLHDEGTEPDWDTETNLIEKTRFRLEVLAPSLAAADAVARAVRWNGQPPASRAGLDFTDALAVDGQTCKAVLPGKARRSQETGRGVDAKPVFRVSMGYEADMLVRAGG